MLRVRHDLLIRSVYIALYRFVFIYTTTFPPQPSVNFSQVFIFAVSTRFFMSKKLLDGNTLSIEHTCSILVSCFVGLCAALQFALYLVQTIRSCMCGPKQPLCC